MALSMTKSELVKMLDAKIRSRVRWRLDEIVDRESGLGNPPSVDEKKLKALAARIYDDVISDSSYDENLLKATRALGDGKFTATYVRRLIKRGLGDGTFTVESARLAKMVTEAVKVETEGKAVTFTTKSGKKVVFKG